MSAHHDLTIEAVKSSPPVTVVALTLGGIPLQEWVYILTIVYLVLQMGWFVWAKIFRKAPASE